MNQRYAGYAEDPSLAATTEGRERFIVRTYNHLFGAIVLFAAIEVALFTSGLAATIARAMLGTSWLLVMGGFVVVSWIASRAAHTAAICSAR